MTTDLNITPINWLLVTWPSSLRQILRCAQRRILFYFKFEFTPIWSPLPIRQVLLASTINLARPEVLLASTKKTCYTWIWWLDDPEVDPVMQNRILKRGWWRTLECLVTTAWRKVGEPNRAMKKLRWWWTWVKEPHHSESRSPWCRIIKIPWCWIIKIPLMLNYQDPLMLNHQDPPDTESSRSPGCWIVPAVSMSSWMIYYYLLCGVHECDGARFYWRIIAVDGGVKIFSSKMDQVATIFCHIGVKKEQKLMWADKLNGNLSLMKTYYHRSWVEMLSPRGECCCDATRLQPLHSSHLYRDYDEALIRNDFATKQRGKQTTTRPIIESSNKLRKMKFVTWSYLFFFIFCYAARTFNISLKK